MISNSTFTKVLNNSSLQFRGFDREVLYSRAWEILQHINSLSQWLPRPFDGHLVPMSATPTDPNNPPYCLRVDGTPIPTVMPPMLLLTRPQHHQNPSCTPGLQLQHPHPQAQRPNARLKPQSPTPTFASPSASSSAAPSSIPWYEGTDPPSPPTLVSLPLHDRTNTPSRPQPDSTTTTPPQSPSVTTSENANPA